jgi:hypothetical protein
VWMVRFGSLIDRRLGREAQFKEKKYKFFFIYVF